MKIKQIFSSLFYFFMSKYPMDLSGRKKQINLLDKLTREFTTSVEPEFKMKILQMHINKGTYDPMLFKVFQSKQRMSLC